MFKISITAAQKQKQMKIISLCLKFPLVSLRLFSEQPKIAGGKALKYLLEPS